MALRDLPAVDSLADELGGDGIPRVLAVEAARHAIAAARERILAGDEVDPEALARRELASLRNSRPRRLINATGVLLHTNLGRAALHADAAALADEVAAGYSPLEMDLMTERRGGRGGYVKRLLTTLSGAEAALVVNNNAGALYLALAALAGGGNVVVSRGELIEIGGSLRLPELMAASGATLLEVGTTNRTRIADYAAVADRAAVILKVHPSNYRIEGFAEDASYVELATLAADRGIPFVADVGSGLLDDRVPWLGGPPPPWLADEPAVRQTLEAGASVVLFSGDKLLGGPQAGAAVGSAGAIDTMAKHPVARAVRCDAPTLAALAATLELYADGRAIEVPFWAMTAVPYGDLEVRAAAVASGVAGAEVVSGHSLPGAGSVPGRTLPSPVVRVGGEPDARWRLLADAPVPVIARREADALVVDLRAVAPEDDGHVAEALAAACR